jgi:hypothetical protein
MPLALLAAIPPIMQWLIDAGSGPIFRRYGARRALASAPMTPGPSEIFSPLPWRTQFRHPPASTTRTESVTAWPDRLVPAARNVTGMFKGAAVRRRCATSSGVFALTTIFGTRR